MGQDVPEELAGADVTVALTGDVMTGRGVDQILPVPSDPVLYEDFVTDARSYVALAEQVHGAIPRRVPPDYVWGDLLPVLEGHRPAFRILNLETAVTSHDVPWPGKGINYRMHPANLAALTAARPDCCVLANNHVLDWERPGLMETLEVLQAAGIRTAGAGRNGAEAAAPAILPRADGTRLLVFAAGHGSSGVPAEWAATAERSGVNRLPDLSDAGLAAVRGAVRGARRPSDTVVVSVHWGGNWGYRVPAEQIDFAHAMIDEAGADLIHGHSSHHAKGIEVYRGRLILYGCGDLLNDYEGIGGFAEYRGDLAVCYLARLRAGALSRLRMIPLRIRRFRLNRAPPPDADWLAARLDRESRHFGAGVRRADNEVLELRWR